MIKLVRKLFLGVIILGVQPLKAQEIDSSYIGTYAVVLNYLAHDTVGYITITSKTYAYSSIGTDQLESNRGFMKTNSGEYSIKDYNSKNEPDTLNHYTIDFNPKNTNRTWKQLLYSTLRLSGINGYWYLKENTSRSFPQYVFYKIE